MLLLALVFAPGLMAGGVPKWLVIYVAAGCAILCSRRLAFDRVSLAGLAVIAWAALSLMWSNDPAAGALQLHKLAVLAVLFCAARTWGRDWPLPELAIASVAIILVLALFLPTSGFGNENFVTDYLLMLTPFLVVFAGRHKIWAWLPLVAVAVYLVAFNGARAEYLVAGAAMVVALLFLHQRATALIVVLSGLGFLLLWPQVFAKSLLARLELGNVTAAMWWDSPIWGQGFGAFGFEYHRFADAWRWLMLERNSFIGPNEFAGAAHNETLQLMAELGLVGLFLTGLFLFLCLRRAKLSPEVWCLGILGVLSLIGFPLQTPATAALGAVALGVVVGPTKRLIGTVECATVFQRRKIEAFRYLGPPLKFLLIACVAGTAYLGSLEWRGHVAYGQSAMVIRDDPLSAFRFNLRALEIYPWDWQIRHQLYRTFAALAQRRTVKVGKAAMNRIYTISASAAPFAPYVAMERKP